MSIVILGSGIIGLILALRLSRLTKGDLNIILIDQYPSSLCNVSFFLKHPKVIALSRGSYFELMKLDINSILSIYSTIIDQIEISEYGGSNEVFIRSKDYELSALGYVVELYPIRKQLFNILSNTSDVTIYYSVKIKFIKYESSHNIIFLSNGKYITTKLIVVTDESCLKDVNSYNIQWFKYNYCQTAVVSEITTELSNFGQAFERFTLCGSLAFLPMLNKLSFLVWCVSNQKQKEILYWSKSKFIQELQDLFGWKLGNILDVSTLYFYDLWLVYAKNYFSHRLVLVGNAAQRLHPIAGQGFNLGMRDIVVLSNIICQTLYNNNDIGDFSMLYTYQKSRRLDQYKTIIMTDSLVRLFGSHYLPVIFARRLGLLCMENCIFLKNFFVNQFLYWKI